MRDFEAVFQAMVSQRDGALIVAPDALFFVDEANERFRRERTRLLVIKPWFKHATRKWSFEWNGVPISAPITDPDFLNRIQRHEVVFGAGDALDVEISYRQTFSPDLGIFENDNSSFVISRVIATVATRLSGLFRSNHRRRRDSNLQPAE